MFQDDGERQPGLIFFPAMTPDASQSFIKKAWPPPGTGTSNKPSRPIP
jgi:hypothetical protein